MVISRSSFAGMKFQPVQPGQISPSDYMGKSIFIPAKRDRFPPGICLQNPKIPSDLKMFIKWWNSIKTFVYFFLTDRRHIRRKNTIEIATIYWNVLHAQTDVLINFFIPLRRAKAIAWENFIPVKRDPGTTKEGSCLLGMKFFKCNRKI